MGWFRPRSVALLAPLIGSTRYPDIINLGEKLARFKK
jgi:hypothetical protein